MQTLIKNYLHKLKTALDNFDKNEIETFINVLNDAKNKENTIYVMGNGGSASTASHFACDIAKGVSFGKEKKFKVISLNDNIPTIMAYANDISFEDIFSEQLKNLLKKDDLVIAFSGSGNSKNIIKAIEYANSIGATTIGITGFGGGKLKQIAKYSVNANIDDMQISEDLHTVLMHIAMQILEKD